MATPALPPAHPSDQPPLRFQAATPSLGVRLWIVPGPGGQPDMVSLQVANEGGRGMAAATVLVPVEVDPSGGVRPAMRLEAFLAADAGQPDQALNLLWRTGSRVLPTPFSLRWYGDEWRQITADTPWVLVLMLYPNPRVGPCTTTTTTTITREDGVSALKAFFVELDADRPGGRRAAWLRRGLVYLAPADIPPSRPAPGAQPTVAAPAVAPITVAPFTFAVGSCQYPAGLVDGTPQDHADAGQAMPPGPADASLLRLAARLDDPDDRRRPSLLVLTGDQIYADATAGLFDPRAGRVPAPRSSVRDAEDWLRVPYQNWYGSVGAQSVLGRLVTLMMLDDHEIDDNWQPLAITAGPGSTARMQQMARLDRLKDAGSQGYQRYQRDLRDAELLTCLWHQRQHRGIGFFMADTRTERQARQAATDPLRPRIMGGLQSTALATWMAGTGDAPRDRPAFVVSPSMLLPRRRSSLGSPRAALRSDAWDGYPGSLHQLLVQLWQAGRSNLVFLSGDEHLSCVVKATVTKEDGTGRAVTLHSVHSSGLYSPYPFANSVPALFALPDEWTFDDPQSPGQRYRCVVEPCGLDATGQPWAPGDGFALLALTPPAPAGPQQEAATATADWQLDVRFDRAAPWAEGRAQAPAASGAAPACTLILAPGPGSLQGP